MKLFVLLASCLALSNAYQIPAMVKPQQIAATSLRARELAHNQPDSASLPWQAHLPMN